MDRRRHPLGVVMPELAVDLVEEPHGGLVFGRELPELRARLAADNTQPESGARLERRC